MAGFRQGTTGNGTSSPTTSTAFGSSVLEGSMIFVNVCDDSGTTASVSAVNDSAGNTYQQVTYVHGTSSMSLWYATNVKGGSSFTVAATWNIANTTGVTICAQEHTGVLIASPLDVSLVGGPTTSTAASSGASASTANPSELVIGAAIHASTTSAFSLGAGYTNLTTNNIANRATAVESKLVAATGSQTATFTIAASREWLCAVVTFKLAYPIQFNNYQQLKTGDGMSISEKIR